MKKGVLVHELGHRILFNLKKSYGDLSEHQVLNLFLYDAWVELYGNDFAGDQVTRERKLSEEYNKAWNWALQIENREERQEKFKEIKEKYLRT